MDCKSWLKGALAAFLVVGSAAEAFAAETLVLIPQKQINPQCMFSAFGPHVTDEDFAGHGPEVSTRWSVLFPAGAATNFKIKVWAQMWEPIPDHTTGTIGERTFTVNVPSGYSRFTKAFRIDANGVWSWAPVSAPTGWGKSVDWVDTDHDLDTIQVNGWFLERIASYGDTPGSDFVHGSYYLCGGKAMIMALTSDMFWMVE